VRAQPYHLFPVCKYVPKVTHGSTHTSPACQKCYSVNRSVRGGGEHCSERRSSSSSEHGSEVRFQAVSRLTGFASRGKNVEGSICAKIFPLN